MDMGLDIGKWAGRKEAGRTLLGQLISQMQAALERMDDAEVGVGGKEQVLPAIQRELEAGCPTAVIS